MKKGILNFSKIGLIDRYEYVLKKCKDKNVLDLGCVDHDFLIHSKNKDHKWLHREIGQVSSSLLGVDFLEEDVKLMNKNGYNVVKQNVEKLNLDKKFDVIIAGEIIEHLQNVGMFLLSCKKHLKNDGILIITTPNPFYYLHQYQVLRFGYPIIHEEHTCYFDPQTLSYMGKLNGFIVEDIYFSKLYKKWHRIISFFTYIRKFWSQGFIITFRNK